MGGNPVHRAQMEIKPMPNRFSQKVESDAADSPDFPGLFQQLVRDGKGWWKSEFALFKAQSKGAVSSALGAIILAAIGLIFALVGAIFLGQSAVAVLTPWLGSAAQSALLVAIITILISVALFIWARWKILSLLNLQRGGGAKLP